MKYLKPLFNIERIHVNGSRLYYELAYRQGPSFETIACFYTWKEAHDFRDILLEG